MGDVSRWWVIAEPPLRLSVTIVFCWNANMLAGKSIPVTLQRVSSSGLQEMWQWELERLQSYREWYLQQRLVTLHTCLFIYSFVRLQYWLTQQKPKWWPWDQQVDRLRLTPTCNKKRCGKCPSNKPWSHLSTWWRSIPSKLQNTKRERLFLLCCF